MVWVFQYPALDHHYVNWIRGRTGKTKKAALLRLREKFKADKDLYWNPYDKGRPLAETGNRMLKIRLRRFGRQRALVEVMEGAS